MNKPHLSNYQQNYTVGDKRDFRIEKTQLLSHQDMVRRELKKLGASWFAMLRAELRYLPQIIHPNEHIGGVVYGRHHDDFALLVATDRRVIFLDKKPLFTDEDEITYYVVSGVSHGQGGLFSTVTLHTRIKDYPITTFNQKCARGFIAYIEARTIEHKNTKDVQRYDISN